MDIAKVGAVWILCHQRLPLKFYGDGNFPDVEGKFFPIADCVYFSNADSVCFSIADYVCDFIGDIFGLFPVGLVLVITAEIGEGVSLLHLNR